MKAEFSNLLLTALMLSGSGCSQRHTLDHVEGEWCRGTVTYVIPDDSSWASNESYNFEVCFRSNTFVSMDIISNELDATTMTFLHCGTFHISQLPDGSHQIVIDDEWDKSPPETGTITCTAGQLTMEMTKKRGRAVGFAFSRGTATNLRSRGLVNTNGSPVYPSNQSKQAPQSN